MTIKELLLSVKFDNVVDNIIKLYPDMKYNIDEFKSQYDYLCNMEPVVHEESSDKVCRFRLIESPDGKLRPDAYLLEGDYWEHNLTKEIIVETGQYISNEDMVACCLWHMVFFGFFEQELTEQN